jgi:hypothetical protein
MFKNCFKEMLRVSRVPSAGEERLSFSEKLEKVYKLYGICAQLCSNIEYGIAMLLYPKKWEKYSSALKGQAQRVTEARGITDSLEAMNKFDELLKDISQEIDALSKLPLGSLIKQIKDNYPLKEQQETYFKDILDKRNYFIHHIWGKHGIRLKNPEVVTKMLQELEALEPFFRSASSWVWKQARIVNGISSFMDIS